MQLLLLSPTVSVKARYYCTDLEIRICEFMYLVKAFGKPLWLSEPMTSMQRLLEILCIYLLEKSY